MLHQLHARMEDRALRLDEVVPGRCGRAAAAALGQDDSQGDACGGEHDHCHRAEGETPAAGAAARLLDQSLQLFLGGLRPWRRGDGCHRRMELI
jgi:hypothetical protein